MPLPPMMPSTALVMSQCSQKNKGPGRGLCIGSRLWSKRRLSRVLAVSQLARLLDLVPDLLLGEIQKAREHDEEDENLEADALALHQLGLGRPHQEGRHVLGFIVELVRR